MLRFVIALLLGAIAVGACAQTGSGATAVTDPYQIIIKFRAPTEAPASPEFVRQLSADAGTTLRFLRSLATGAQLYGVDGKLDRAEFDAVMQRLKQRSDVLYVEEDRRVDPALKK